MTHILAAVAWEHEGRVTVDPDAYWDPDFAYDVYRGSDDLYDLYADRVDDDRKRAKEDALSGLPPTLYAAVVPYRGVVRGSLPGILRAIIEEES